MQTFALGQHCIRQRRGSPMGSPLFRHFASWWCLSVEQIWSINFKQILSNHHFFIKHIRYVDNRLIFGDARLQQLPPYEVFWTQAFMENQLSLKLNRSRVPWLHARNQTFGTHLPRTHQHFSSSVAILGFTSKGPA